MGIIRMKGIKITCIHCKKEFEYGLTRIERELLIFSYHTRKKFHEISRRTGCKSIFTKTMSKLIAFEQDARAE